MEYSLREKTIALAGIYQSTRLVQKIARKGSVSDAQLSSLIETLFRFDVNSVEEIYGDPSSVKKGLKAIINQLSGDKKKLDMELTRYAIGILHLEKALRKNSRMMDKLSDDLQRTQNKMDYFDVTHDNIIASLADIYQQNISPIGPKIMVQGEPEYLSQQNNANKIRALLFAGIRSAVLWRQCGGSRWQLLFGRKNTIKMAQEILNSL